MTELSLLTEEEEELWLTDNVDSDGVDTLSLDSGAELLWLDSELEMTVEGLGDWDIDSLLPLGELDDSDGVGCMLDSTKADD